MVKEKKKTEEGRKEREGGTSRGSEGVERVLLRGIERGSWASPPVTSVGGRSVSLVFVLVLQVIRVAQTTDHILLYTAGTDGYDLPGNSHSEQRGGMI